MINRLARTALAAIAIAGLALLAGGCGGGSSSTGTSGATTADAANSQAPSPLAFARCMRSHGVQHWPDPSSSGAFDKTQLTPQRLGVSTSVIVSASQACQHLLPNTGQPTTTHAEVEAALSGMDQVAACMHSRGVQDWPDPTVDREHPNDPRPVFMLASIDPNSPQISADIRACQHFTPQSASPYICSRVLAEQIGGPPGAYACIGGSPEVP